MFCAALGSIRLAAQSPLTAGVTIGTVKLTDARSEQALTGVVRYEATPWLGLSVMPAAVHVSDVISGRSVSSSGLGDLPLSADAFHAFATPGSPVVAAALTVVLPEGNATCGLGSGETSVGLDLGVGVSPSRRLRVSADASRSISGLSAQSALAAPHATSLRAEAGYDLSPRWRADLALGADVGQSDSTQALSRVLSAGTSHVLAGSVVLALDGGVGLSAASPKWTLALGVGTAFSGISPVSPASSLRRLKSAFGGGVSRGSGAGKVGCR
jgi:hypothetical protein